MWSVVQCETNLGGLFDRHPSGIHNSLAPAVGPKPEYCFRNSAWFSGAKGWRINAKSKPPRIWAKVCVLSDSLEATVVTEFRVSTPYVRFTRNYLPTVWVGTELGRAFEKVVCFKSESLMYFDSRIGQLWAYRIYLEVILIQIVWFWNFNIKQPRNIFYSGWILAIRWITYRESVIRRLGLAASGEMEKGPKFFWDFTPLFSV